MKLSKIAALLMLPVLALTLAACSAPKGDAKDATSGDAQIAELIAQKPSSAEEAAKLYQQLLQKENEIFASDNALWEKVFLAANKDTPMIEDGKNYGDFLLDTIEGAKDQFAADELKTLKAGAQQVKEIEDKLNNMYLVLESLVLDAGNGKIKALVVPDYEQAEAEGVDKADLPQIMQNNLQELNAQLAAYERISGIALYPNEFEKTPKRSIKRYLYEPSLLNK